MREFLSKAFGSTPIPSLRKDKDNLIFMPNDPNVIESAHLLEDCPNAQRKPDVVGVFTSYLSKIDQNLETMSYEEIADLVAEGGVKWNPDEHPEWYDFTHVWELKVEDRDMVMPECDNWSHEKIMQDLSKKPNNSRKRARGKNHRARKKKNTKTPSTSLLPSIHTNILPSSPGSSSEDEPTTTLPLATQCAYYGIERSSSAWHATHSTVIALKGVCFPILHY